MTMTTMMTIKMDFYEDRDDNDDKEGIVVTLVAKVAVVKNNKK